MSKLRSFQTIFFIVIGDTTHVSELKHLFFDKHSRSNKNFSAVVASFPEFQNARASSFTFFGSIRFLSTSTRDSNYFSSSLEKIFRASNVEAFLIEESTKSTLQKEVLQLVARKDDSLYFCGPYSSKILKLQASYLRRPVKDDLTFCSNLLFKVNNFARTQP